MAGDVMGPDPVANAGTEGLGASPAPGTAQPAAGTSTAAPTPAAGTSAPPTAGAPPVNAVAQTAAQKGAADAQKQAIQQNVPPPAPKGTLGARILMSVADALGGPRTKSTINPTTGQTTVEAIPTRVRALHFLGDMMLAEGAGMAAHGPGHVGQAAIMGAQAVQQQHQINDEKEQRDLLNKAQVYRDHMNNMMIQNNIGYKNADGLQKMAENDKPLLDSLVGSNTQDLTSDQPQGIGHAQLMDVLSNYQKGGGKAADLIPVRVGVLPVQDPKTGKQMVDSDGIPVWENSYKAFKDGMTKLTPEQAKLYSTLPGQPPIAEGQEIHASKAYQLQTQVNRITSSAEAIMHQAQGIDPKIGKIDTSDPNTARALDNYSMFLGQAKGDPSVAVDLMAKAGKDITPIVKAYGGEANVQKVSNDLADKAAASKKAAEVQAEQPFKEAAERRAENRGEDKEHRAEERKDRQTQGYAEGPDGQVYITNKHEAGVSNHPFEEMKPGDINKDKQALRMLNDVQANTSRYTHAAQVYGDPNTILTHHGDPVDAKHPVAVENPSNLFGKSSTITDKKAMYDRDNTNFTSLLTQAGWGDINASISAGGHIEIPVITKFGQNLSQSLKSKAYDELSDQGKALWNGYIRTMSAVPAYQKALTGIGRSNKEMLDLELANIGQPGLAASDILEKQKAFQENIDRATEGFPINMVGVKNPKATRQQFEGNPQATGQQLPPDVQRAMQPLQ